MKKLFYPIKTVLLTIWLVYPVSLLAQEHPGLFVQLGVIAALMSKPPLFRQTVNIW
ncbi:MAG TPA: hypothetical protein PK114_09120 [Smithellaceae bacterium]|nr:hypothetical protein [Smithellaceae bacterium]